jgi:hypothetical protein
MDDSDTAKKLRHDRRGRFNAIRLCVEVLMSEPDPQKAVPWLEMIESAADDWLRLSDELNAMSSGTLRQRHPPHGESTADPHPRP